MLRVNDKLLHSTTNVVVQSIICKLEKNDDINGSNISTVSHVNEFNLR